MKLGLTAHPERGVKRIFLLEEIGSSKGRIPFNYAVRPGKAEHMQLSELKNLHVSELLETATTAGIEGANRMRKQDLVFAMLKNQAKKGESIFGDGTLEVLPDGFGFLRSPETSYLASTDDIYVSPSQIRRFNLHTGEIRHPRHPHPDAVQERQRRGDQGGRAVEVPAHGFP